MATHSAILSSRVTGQRMLRKRIRARCSTNGTMAMNWECRWSDSDAWLYSRMMLTPCRAGSPGLHRWVTLTHDRKCDGGERRIEARQKGRAVKPAKKLRAIVVHLEPSARIEPDPPGGWRRVPRVLNLLFTDAPKKRCEFGLIWSWATGIGTWSNLCPQVNATLH